MLFPASDKTTRESSATSVSIEESAKLFIEFQLFDVSKLHLFKKVKLLLMFKNHIETQFKQRVLAQRTDNVRIFLREIVDKVRNGARNLPTEGLEPPTDG